MSKKPGENSSKNSVNTQSTESRNGKNDTHAAAAGEGKHQPVQAKPGHDKEQNPKAHENKHK